MAKKTKAAKVLAYVGENPDAKVSEVAKATKVSYGYVHKIMSSRGLINSKKRAGRKASVSLEDFKSDVLGAAANFDVGGKPVKKPLPSGKELSSFSGGTKEAYEIAASAARISNEVIGKQLTVKDVLIVQAALRLAKFKNENPKPAVSEWRNIL